MTREKYFEICKREGLHVEDEDWFWETRPKWVDEAGGEYRLEMTVRDLVDTAFKYGLKTKEHGN